MNSPTLKPILRRLLGVLILLAAASAARAADSSYVRLLPNDGNNVYPAAGLLRQWPAEGPKELWRTNIGGRYIRSCKAKRGAKSMISTMPPSLS